MAVCWSVLLFFISFIILLILKKLLWVAKVPDLRSKHVLITGGSSGIGKATAVEAAKLGAHVTLVARDEEKLKAAVKEIESAAKYKETQSLQYVSLDVTKGLSQVDSIIKSVEYSVGPVFLLVNCAGMAICNTFEDASEEDFRHMMDLNYYGTVFPTLSVAKRMKERKEGHIVITGSQASLLGIYGMSAYCSSKFALRGFAESLYMELNPYNVSVTVCLPPDTNTPGFATEEKSKPEVTRLISETAGLFEPSVVAHRMLSDALVGERRKKKFFSVVGFEGFILATLCAGMSPIGGSSDVFLQVALMSLLRLISVGYLLHFHRIISNYTKLSTGKSKPHSVKTD